MEIASSYENSSKRCNRMVGASKDNTAALPS
jgi:hypothetical protein